MAIDPELNLFTSDPDLLRPGADAQYERASAALSEIARPERMRILHALVVGENTAQRAALWCGLPQTLVERELAALADAGIVERIDESAPTYLPSDGHVVVQLHVALAHGSDAGAQPRLLARRGGRARRLARAG